MVTLGVDALNRALRRDVEIRIQLVYSFENESCRPAES